MNKNPSKVYTSSLAYMFCNSLSSCKSPSTPSFFIYCNVFVEEIKLLVGTVVAHSLDFAGCFPIASVFLLLCISCKLVIGCRDGLIKFSSFFWQNPFLGDGVFFYREPIMSGWLSFFDVNSCCHSTLKVHAFQLQ